MVENNLPSTGEASVGFTRWRVVLGHGHDKKVLFEIGRAASVELPATR